jgi:hypothetical protein
MTDCQRARLQAVSDGNIPRYAEMAGLIKTDERSGEEIVDELFKKFNWRR